jgi:GT2 family glycosyltransferase
MHNGADYLKRSLDALNASDCRAKEIIVVDDASTDGSVDEVLRRGIKVVRLKKNLGPAGARNAGAKKASGDVLLFVDADVVVRKDTLSRVAGFFERDPGAAAVFGSYDDAPEHGGFVSQYRNLLHHYHHQRAAPDAFSFWAGCGAIRKSVFEEVGGFDEERYPYPSIEDIELGWRIRKHGGRIALDKGLLVKHLKGWGFASMVRTDILRRALPWSRLILETGSMPKDLNLKAAEKASAFLVLLSIILMITTVASIGMGRSFGASAMALAASLSIFFYLNRPLYSFYAQRRGPAFAVKVVPLHALYYVYSASAFAYCRLEHAIMKRS